MKRTLIIKSKSQTRILHRSKLFWLSTDTNTIILNFLENTDAMNYIDIIKPKSLKGFTLNINTFLTSRILDNIFSLVKLETLNMNGYNTKFILDNVSKLTNLKQLTLLGKDHSSTNIDIRAILSLTKLKELSLSKCGTIYQGEETSFSNLFQLTSLSLNGDYGSYLTNFSKKLVLPQLVNLTLNNFILSDVFSHLSNLVYLDVSSSYMTSFVFDTICSMTNLRSLSFSHNRSMPFHLPPNLISLKIDTILFMDATSLGELNHLTILNITTLNDIMLDHISAFPSLRTFVYKGNRCPILTVKLPSITNLDICCNNLDIFNFVNVSNLIGLKINPSTIPLLTTLSIRASYKANINSSLISLCSLKSLKLEGFPISKGSWLLISTMTQLTSLNLDKTYHTHSDMSFILPLTNLTKLSLHNKDIDNTQLISLSCLTKLEELNIIGNLKITRQAVATLSRLKKVYTNSF